MSWECEFDCDRLDTLLGESNRDRGRTDGRRLDKRSLAAMHRFSRSAYAVVVQLHHECIAERDVATAVAVGIGCLLVVPGKS